MKNFNRNYFNVLRHKSKIVGVLTAIINNSLHAFEPNERLNEDDVVENIMISMSHPCNNVEGITAFDYLLDKVAPGYANDEKKHNIAFSIIAAGIAGAGYEISRLKYLKLLPSDDEKKETAKQIAEHVFREDIRLEAS